MPSDLISIILLSLCFFVVLIIIYQASTGKFSSKLPEMGKAKAKPHAHQHKNHNKRTSASIITRSEAIKSPQEVEKLNATIFHLEDQNNVLRMQVNAQRNQIAILKKHNDGLSEINNELFKQKDMLHIREKELSDLQQRKEDLFAMTIHDLKNPAGAMKGYVDLLRSYDFNAQEQQEIMGHLLSTSSRIIEIAQSISTIIAESESGNGLKLKRTATKIIIDDICTRNNNYAKSKGIKIINTSSPDCPQILMDRFKIEEAFENLLNNAIKFGRAETIVQVRSYFTSIHVIIEISDNGVGMSQDDMAKAFIRGTKLTARPTGGETSSGLGLWIVKNIVEDHGGTVTIDSKLGAGTKFTILLPINPTSNQQL